MSGRPGDVQAPGVGAFVVALRERGFSERELDVMMKDNPARLLGLSAP